MEMEIQKTSNLENGLVECIVKYKDKVIKAYYGGDLDEIELSEEIDIPMEKLYNLIEDYENKLIYKSPPQPIEPRITTITKTCRIIDDHKNDVYIDLECVFRNIQLTKNIFSVKLKDKYRNFNLTDEPLKSKKRTNICKKHKKTFCNDCKKNTLYNQCSVVYYINPVRDAKKKLGDKEKINVKIFKNGELQMTGIRSIESSHLAEQEILKCLSKIKGTYKVQLVEKNGLIMDEFNKIYTAGEFGYKQIGFLQNDQRTSRKLHVPNIYLWNKDRYNIVVYSKDNLLIEQFYNKNLIKHVFNKNGECIGNYSIEINKDYLDEKQIDINNLNFNIKDKSFIITNKDDKFKWYISEEHSCIIDKDNYKVGKILQNFVYKDFIRPVIPKSPVSVDYYCINSSLDLHIINPVIHMFNTVFELNLHKGTKLHLNKFNTLLIKKYNFNSVYNPGAGYLAMNTKYFYNKKNKDCKGICKCSLVPCDMCLHERKHLKECVDCESEIKNTGNLCNACINCETCIHQNVCKLKNCNKCKCTCDPCDCISISILCFHTGKIITTGSCKEYSQILEAYYWFIDIFHKEYYNVII